MGMDDCVGARHLKVKAGTEEGTDLLYICRQHQLAHLTSHEMLCEQDEHFKAIRINVKRTYHLNDHDDVFDLEDKLEKVKVGETFKV